MGPYPEVTVAGSGGENGPGAVPDDGLLADGDFFFLDGVDLPSFNCLLRRFHSSCGAGGKDAMSAAVTASVLLTSPSSSLLLLL